MNREENGMYLDMLTAGTEAEKTSRDAHRAEMDAEIEAVKKEAAAKIENIKAKYRELYGIDEDPYKEMLNAMNM